MLCSIEASAGNCRCVSVCSRTVEAGSWRVNVYEGLRSMYSSEQLEQLEKVRDKMIDDPTILDNHSREKRNASGEEASEAGKS